MIKFKHPLFESIHDFILPFVLSSKSNAFIARFQQLCGITTDGKIGNYPLYYFFKVASQLGEDVIVLPLVIWFVAEIGSAFSVYFCLMLITSQVFKDLLLLPRPPEHFTINGERRSIIKLEGKFGTEYGFPSSHTVSGLLPLGALVALNKIGYPFSSLYASMMLLCAICVSSSRMFVGVHSPADIFGGVLLSTVWLGISFYLPVIEIVEHLTCGGGVWSIIICANIVALFVHCYPRARPWRASFGTSAIIVGIWLGCALSFNLIHYLNNGPLSQRMAESIVGKDGATVELLQGVASLLQSSVLRNSSPSIFVVLCKIVIGGCITGVCYVIGKLIGVAIFENILRAGLTTIHREETYDNFGNPVAVSKCYAVEIPTRLFYGALMSIGFTVLTPMAWALLKL